MDDDDNSPPRLLLQDPGGNNVPTPTPHQTRSIATALEQSLIGLLKEMDASQTLLVGSEAWTRNIQKQVQHLQDLNGVFQTSGSTPTKAGIIMLNLWTPQITTILRTAIYNVNLQTDMMNESTKSRIRTVHRSAALCLRRLVQAITNQPTGRFPHVKPCIMALLRGLVEVVQTDKPTVQQSLEDPTSTWLEIMVSIQALLQVYHDEDEIGTLPTCNDLVLRLVGHATTLMSSTTNNNTALKIESVAVLATCMTTISTDSALWQAMFPGTLAAIYQCLLSCHRQASTGQSVVLECSCLGAIRLLLLITLQGIQEERSKAAHEKLSSTTTMLQSLRLKSHQNSRSIETNPSAPSTDFLSNVHDKAVSHLILLLQQSTASRTPKVQMEVILLSRAILIDTSLCWKGSNLLEAALECCLILQNDTMNEDVSSSARSVVQSYQMSAQDRSMILSKIHSLVQELPTLVEGGKSINCTTHLQLVQGYIYALVSCGGSTTSSSTASSGSGKTMTASSFPYQPFIQLMDLDLAASSKPTRLVWEVGVQMLQSRLPIRRLSSEQTRLVHKVLVAIGQALGPKQGAFVVDSLLSDIFDAWHRENLSLSMLGRWAGSIAVATQIMFGAFSSQHENDGELSPKDDRRRRRILNELASSVLPLLMDPPLNEWNRSTISVQQGIASILILSLELTTVLVNLMLDNDDGSDSESLFQALLYPLISKAHAGNGKLIREAALEGIDNLAYASGRHPRSQLIVDQCGMLFAEMLSRLRVPGGGQSPAVADETETRSVVHGLTWVLEECANNDHSEPPKQHPASPSSILVELVGQVMDRLDHQFLNRSVMEEEAIQLTQMYAAIFKYLKLLHFYDDRPVASNQEQSKSWLRLLSVFEKSPQDAFDGDSVVDSVMDEEMPISGRNEVATASFGKATVSLSSEMIFRLCYLLSNDSLRVRMGACESLTHGFEYLGRGTMRVQGNDGEEVDIRNAVYRQVASSWPSIKARLSTLTDQVVERQRPISSLLIVNATNSNGNSSSASLGDSKTGLATVGSQRIFLARLYILIATMFECSGDFMADRFGSSVWPIMAKQFEHLMVVQSKNPRQITPSSVRNVGDYDMIDRDKESTRPWVDSKRHLAMGMFHCLSRVFSCKGSYGTVLIRIHQAVGLVLLPFLDTDDYDKDISNAAMKALQSILSHDADILLRPLLELSGKGIPPCPIRRLDCLVPNHPARVEATSSNRSNLAKRCRELLEFIAALPEQELE